MNQPPVIQTARLTLRGHRVGDYGASSAMWADVNVARYLSAKPSSPQHSWLRLLNYAGHWALLGFGYWVIEESATQAFVGEAGFADFKRDLDPPLDGIPEAGWALSAGMQGRGFATEAVRAIVAWSDRRAWNETVCIIDPANRASIRVAHKCGYNETRRVLLNGKQLQLFNRISRDVLASGAIS